MSERLLLCLEKDKKNKESFWDCIYTEFGSVEQLLKEWFGCSDDLPYFSGIQKFKIEENSLIPKLINDLKSIKSKHAVENSMFYENIVGLIQELKECSDIDKKNSRKK